MTLELHKLSLGKMVAIIGVWGLMLFGVLQLQHLSLTAASHVLCGPWGCGPPFPPLLASHGFWLVVLSLPTLLICSILDPRALHKTGRLLLIAGLSGLVLVAVWEIVPTLPHWLPRVGSLAPKYWCQRYLLSVATLVDVPVVPIALSGICCIYVAKRRLRRIKIESQEESI